MHSKATVQLKWYFSRRFVLLKHFFNFNLRFLWCYLAVLGSRSMVCCCQQEHVSPEVIGLGIVTKTCMVGFAALPSSWSKCTDWSKPSMGMRSGHEFACITTIYTVGAKSWRASHCCYAVDADATTAVLHKYEIRLCMVVADVEFRSCCAYCAWHYLMLHKP